MRRSMSTSRLLRVALFFVVFMCCVFLVINPILRRVLPPFFLPLMTDESSKRGKIYIDRDYHCTRKAIIGASSSGRAVNDGGWNICLDDVQFTDRIREGKCVVYSFGLDHNIDFDLAIAAFGCKVYGFDHTIPEYFHDQKTTVMGHNILAESSGIGVKDEEKMYNGRMAQFRSVASIMKQYNHDHIDILKMDIEGDEWKVFDTIMPFVKKGKIGQLLFEAHFEGSGEGVNKEVERLRALRKAGMHVFNRDDNTIGNFLNINGEEARCCYDMSLIYEPKERLNL